MTEASLLDAKTLVSPVSDAFRPTANISLLTSRIKSLRYFVDLVLDKKGVWSAGTILHSVGANMLRFVWDTSAIVNIKESNNQGYSPARSLWEDMHDGCLKTKYLNLLPAISAFEVWAAVERKHFEGKKILREFYLIGDHEIIYSIDQDLIRKSAEISCLEGFNKLRGADLIFACIAKIEEAILVTLDEQFNKSLSDQIKVVDLNDSRHKAAYRQSKYLAPYFS